ncbi:uncharacterized protein [Euphorbia lathyris]|uniref:uncharacterized protein isoform X2 n=1 Tax=Euphorbia lathyris TaxID=212925 RepID=UPI0033143881
MNFGWEESNRYNPWNQNVQSSLFRVTHPTRYEPLAKETRFQSNANVNFTHLMSHKLSRDCPGKHYKLQKRPLDLQLSADEFINHVEELPKNGNAWNCLEDPRGLEDLKLSLSIGGDGNKVGGSTRNFLMKKTYSYSHNVIDLEESDDRISGYAKSGPSLDSAFLEICPKGEHEMQELAISEPFLPTGVKKIPSVDIAESNSFQEYSECCQEQTNSSNEVRDEVPSNDHSSKMHQLVSCQGLLDLNKVHQDDSSCCSDDRVCAYPSLKSSEGGVNGSITDGTCPTMFQKREVSEPRNGTSPLLEKGKTVNLALLDLNCEYMDEDIRTQNSENNSACNSVVTLVGPEPTLRFSAGMREDLGSFSDGHKNDTVGLKPKRAREVSCERSEEDAPFSCADQSQNSLQVGQGNSSPASCRSYCISDNDSTNGKTLQSGITSDVSDKYTKTNLGSQVADGVNGEHDQRTSDSSHLQNECYNSKGEAAELEFSIQQAAELLIHMSLVDSACGQDSNAKLGSKEAENKKRERPQYSFDSFELNTLNLTESSLDDDAVSSKPFEVDNTEAKKFGLKLRRGRRMKDFQKEILPSLASLSRQEILEDINVMDGVLRSREYRKNRAKMVTCGENWSPPIRSRRSRVNYGGRRNYS